MVGVVFDVEKWVEHHRVRVEERLTYLNMVGEKGAAPPAAPQPPPSLRSVPVMISLNRAA